MSKRNRTTDVTVVNGGSIYLLRPETPEAHDWVEENIGQDNGYQPHYPTVLVEHRFVADIIEGMVDDGLRVA